MIKMKSSLISIQPLGIGTPTVESFFSYLLRLSKANSVTLSELLKLICMEAEIPINTRGEIDNASLSGLNSGGAVSSRIIKVVEGLTGRSDLALMTMQRWRHLFADGFLHRERWFAPALDQLYEPLYWAISPVYWTIQGVPLEQVCHSCHKTSRPVQMRHKIGVCSKCGSQLDQYHKIQAGKADKHTSAHLNYNNREYSIWVTKAVGEMLAFTGDLKAFDFGKCFRIHLDHFGLKTYKETAKRLSISHISARKWAEQGVLPRFDQFLNVCYCMRVGPVEFFRQDLLQVGSSAELRDSPKQTRTAIASAPRKPIDPIVLRDTLLQDMESKQYMHLSFREYCDKQLSRSQAVVRQYEPEIAKRFVAQSKEYQAMHSRTLRAGRIAEVVEAARICLETDADVNHKNLRHYLVQPGMLMSQWARDLIKAIKQYGPDDLPSDVIKV